MVKSKVVGNIFEKLFYRSAARQGMGILRIADGCKRVPGYGRAKIIPVRQACDFVLMHQGQTAFVDTKTLGKAQTFPVSKIDKHQVFQISYMVGHGARGGYICWFRDIDKVVYYPSQVLRIADEGLHWEDGIYLGPIEEINLERIF